MTFSCVPWFWCVQETINTNMSTYIILFGGEIMKKGINFPKTKEIQGERKKPTYNETE